jgi:hypothetical protein
LEEDLTFQVLRAVWAVPEATVHSPSLQSWLPAEPGSDLLAEPVAQRVDFLLSVRRAPVGIQRAESVPVPAARAVALLVTPIPTEAVLVPETPVEAVPVLPTRTEAVPVSATRAEAARELVDLLVQPPKTSVLQQATWAFVATAAQVATPPALWESVANCLQPSSLV